MRKSIVFALAGTMAVGLSSCHIYQKYDLPADNAIVSDYARAVGETPDSTSLGYLGWEQVFTDPQLQALIRQALENNTDLDNARLNVEIARAQLKGAKLSYFPSLALAPNGGTASYGGSHMNWSYTIPLSASWEIDAFGKILNRKRGAAVAVEQAEAYAQAARSQIICGVASAYYSLVLLNQQLDLTRRTSEIWADQVESMKLLKEAGRTNEAAVVQSQANYYSIMASIPDLEQQITTVQNTLSVLLNTYPQTWSVSGKLDFSLPVEITEGMPLNYLATRPDVAAAERSMAVAFYSLNSARTNFYPSLVISAQGGFTNMLGSMISNPGKWFIQLAGSLTAPIFSRGQNLATYEAAKAQQKQAVNNFEKTVLSAAADVSDAMVSISKNTAKRAMIEKQIDALEKSVEYTNELFMYNQGTTYLEVLTARSSLLQAQLAALACWHTKATSLINLYQAVGGGR
ncbi:MAG: TolC family protein [Muribaculaceae bacterium]|nr:TolC family protein [Muribaculaceae bacterium]